MFSLTIDYILLPRKNLCINTEVKKHQYGKEIDSHCHSLTASYVRIQHKQDESVPVCQYFEVHFENYALSRNKIHWMNIKSNGNFLEFR